MQVSWLLAQFLWAPVSPGQLLLCVPLWCPWNPPPSLFNPSSLSSAWFTELSPILGCESLYLFQSVTGWSLSNDHQGSQQSMSIAVYQNVTRHHYIDIIFPNCFWVFWFYARSLGYPAFGWSIGVGSLLLYGSKAGPVIDWLLLQFLFYLNTCIPALPIVRTDCSSNVVCLGQASQTLHWKSHLVTKKCGQFRVCIQHCYKS